MLTSQIRSGLALRRLCRGFRQGHHHSFGSHYRLFRRQEQLRADLVTNIPRHFIEGDQPLPSQIEPLGTFDDSVFEYVPQLARVAELADILRR